MVVVLSKSGDQDPVKPSKEMTGNGLDPPLQIELMASKVGVVYGFTVTLMLLLCAVIGLTQASLLVITTMTSSLLARVVMVKVLLLVPSFTPFTCHWYAGKVPPLKGVAVKVMLPPAHMDVNGEAIVTDGVTVEVVMVISLLVTDAGEAHTSLLVITTVTTSLFARELDVNSEVISPATVVPLICHS